MFIKKLFIKKIKEKLEKGKVSIEEQLQSFAKKDKKLAGDWETRFPKFNGGNLEEEADEVEEYEALLPIEFALENKLKDTNLALEKIKRGEYGKCEKCQKEISRQRLQVCPEARFCLKCQKK